MKNVVRACGAGAVLALVLSGSQAEAQQQAPQPVPEQTAVAITSWPTTAARYHVYVTWMIKEMSKLLGVPQAHVTQGDINKVALRVKDCEASVAADGIVTRNEFRMCERVWDQAFSELLANAGE